MSSNIPCPTCDRPRRGDEHVCGACQGDLRRSLEAIPDLVADLETSLARLSAGPRPGGTRQPENDGLDRVPAVLHEGSLPYDPRAAEALAVLRSTLVGWVRMLLDGLEPVTVVSGPRCERCGHESCRTIAHAAAVNAYVRWPGDTLPEMSRWLLMRLLRLLAHPAAEEAVDEICAAVAAGRRVVDRPEAEAFAGRCPRCGEGLYARPGAATVRCRGEECHDEDPVDVAEQHAGMAEQIGDQLFHSVAMSAVLANLGLVVPASTIRRWASKGRLLAHGEDANRRPLYRVDEVLALYDEREKLAAERREEKAQRAARKNERIGA